jgi:mitochondrial fission protein ELM1
MRSGFRHVEKIFDLALLPIHDRPPQNSRVIPLLGIPTTITEEEVTEAANFLSQRLSLRNGKRIGFLVGGNSRRLKMKSRWMKQVSQALLDACTGNTGMSDAAKAQNGSYEILLATSRRTPKKIEEILHNDLNDKNFVHLLWAKDYPENPIPGVLGLSDVVLVTEDSFSMLMEAVHSGRFVISLRMARQGFRGNKYERTLQVLEKEGRIHRASPKELKSRIQDLLNRNGASKKVHNLERDRSVQAILELVRN